MSTLIKWIIVFVGIVITVGSFITDMLPVRLIGFGIIGFGIGTLWKK